MKTSQRRPLVASLSAWHRLVAELRNPDIELDAETFAAVWSEFAKLRAAGHPFDPMFVALMGVLHRQCLLTDDGIEDAETGIDDAEADGTEEGDGGPLAWSFKRRHAPAEIGHSMTGPLDRFMAAGGVL